ncbi:VanW family protein [Candidatus Gracilibacteria bacterium]|nr:VanW family protein [Candidatus Gracilibacteria bacterium]
MAKKNKRKSAGKTTDASGKKKLPHPKKKAQKKVAAEVSEPSSLVLAAAEMVEELVEPLLPPQHRNPFDWSWLRSIVFGTVAALAICAVVLVGIYYSFESYYVNRVLPNTYVGSLPVGGLTYAEAEQNLVASYQSLAKKPLTVVIDQEQVQLGFVEAGISFDFDRVLSELKSHHPHEVWGAFLWPTHIDHGVIVDRTMLTHALQKAVPEIAALPKDAQVVIAKDAQNKSYFTVAPSESHTTIDFAKVSATILQMLQRGESLPVVAPTYVGTPQISDAGAYQALATAESWLKHDVEIVYKQHLKDFSFDLKPSQDLGWLSFVPQGGALTVRLNEQKWHDLVATKISPVIEQTRQDVTVEMPSGDSKYAKVSGQLKDGYTIDREATRLAIELALQSGSDAPVNLSVQHYPAQFSSSDGADLGLKDLLGTGYSRFIGSSADRKFNVRKGLAIYNNVILAPNQELAFNSLLGDVTVQNGWKEELVIKEGGKKTVPEAGGGICQVSTTMYRALVEAGLKVTERRAHSYLVSYYVSDDDPRAGIDATIYPGSQDLVFTNDTPNYILLQTEMTATEAYFRIYGTADGRSVQLTGPVKSGWKTPGSPILVPTTTLPAGKVNITKKAHNGRTVQWEQIITYNDGTVENHDIISVYKAIPAEGMIGVAAASPANSLPEGNIAL